MFNKRRGIMKLAKNCDNCGNNFEYSPSRRPNARFCSLSCLSKKTKQEQDLKRKQTWDSQSKEEVLEALISRFEKFVIRNDGCWDWNGCKVNGYGVFTFRNGHWKAHRASWTIKNGEIPKGLFILHKCDNPPCSNPEHLFLGNNADNMRDMASKKRTVPRSKLTKEQVCEIKKMLKLGVSSTKLGIDYNVSDVCIHYIKHNITWKD
jgi:hypothetical protein